MIIRFSLFLLIAFSVCFLTTKLNKLTTVGSVVGFLIALSIFTAFGFSGLFILGVFFLIATLATSCNRKAKKAGIPLEKYSTRRDAGQVIANGGIAAIMALLSIAFPLYDKLFLMMMTASLSSATADTISSELGTIYGSRFFNILTFKPDLKGENGVVSFEGLLFGLAGSIFIAIAFSIGFGLDFRFLIIIMAGTIGNLTDSVLGATLERSKHLGNNQVNFLNTLIAALSILLFFPYI